MLCTLLDKNVIIAEICEDQTGAFGLYIVPDHASQICIEESELRTALRIIDENKIS